MSLVTRATTLTLATLTLATLTAIGCGGGSGGDSDSATKPVIADCAGTPEDPCFGTIPEGSDCSEPGDAVFVGEQKAASTGDVMIELVETDPAPPRRFDNAWTVQVTDGSGAPMENATLVASPFMPDHGHPSPSAVEVEDMGGGKYQLNPLNLFMPGLWRISIDVIPEGASDSESVEWKFCLP